MPSKITAANEYGRYPAATRMRLLRTTGRVNSATNRPLKAVSLFTGAGGMDIGFAAAGINAIVANEIMPQAAETYRINHPYTRLFEGSIDDLSEDIVEAGQGADVVFGGPPCQGFSVAGKMDPNDSRSKLIWSFLGIVRAVKPELFIMENVKALATLEKWKPVRNRFLQESASAGYHCEYTVLRASDFGVPQNRERVFFVGSRNKFSLDDLNLTLEELKSQPPTLREVLSSLPEFGSEGNPVTCAAKITLAANPILRKSPYAGMLFNGMGRPLNIDGYSYTLPASMGGNKTPIVDQTLLEDPNTEAWVESYHSALTSNSVTPEFTEAPLRLRRLTSLEAAAIQTFPDGYAFTGPKTSVYAQIGNAVPCKLAAAIAKAARIVAFEGETHEDASHRFGRLL